MLGKIIRGVGGFYYVDVAGEGIYACRARGIFRKEGQKPLVGDNVRIVITHEQDREGNLEEICPRSNMLIRPAASNVDQILLLFSVKQPEPNFNLLDRFLIYMQTLDLPVTLLFTKTDLAEGALLEQLADWYGNCGAKVQFASILQRDGLEEVREGLQGKTTMLAGPSGVGKSSLTNYLCPGADMEVGSLSRKIARGKQTTRHTQIHRIDADSFLLDTPGFSSLFLPEMEEKALAGCYPEFEDYETDCRFPGCLHDQEPDCGVKTALAKGHIPQIRYDNYRLFLQELQERRKF